MRETTERPEGVEAGTLKLVERMKNIVDETEKLLFDEALYKKMSNIKNPYGDGHASERIVDIIINCFKER
ncbi:MAG: UDP-N-acetylglucosamine 2-epimerase [Lachnospira sp.]